MIRYFVIVGFLFAVACNLHPENRQLTITNTKEKMDWKVLREVAEVEEIIKRSEQRPQVIFKHSVRCSISSVVKSRLDRVTAPANADFYYLDLVNFRSVSDKVAEKFNVHHESPQILVIRNGECVYDESHMGITMQDILTHTEF